MSSPDTERDFEEQLREAGNKLLQPPSSIDELLPLLDEVESSLSKVEQSPAKSTHTALSSLMKALAVDELLRHPDIDVKVAVASCISEITRITAPDAPYDDDKMKDVFQLIVSAFENLSDKSSRSYNKRALILETLAKVRSCVIMLDLECDELITEMFQIFLRTIRDYHPDDIFSSMETIMSLVLDESEDVSIELLTTLLSSVKKDNQEVSPIARRLGERVFENCAVKLKPYLIQAIKSLDISFDDYCKIVSSVCEGTVGHNHDNASREQLGDGSKPARTSSNETTQETEDVVKGVCQEDVDPAANKSPKSSMSNGISETKKEENSLEVECPEKGEHLDTDKTTIDEVTPKARSDDLGAEKSTISESQPEEFSKEKGRELSSSTKSTESSNPPHNTDKTTIDEVTPKPRFDDLGAEKSTISESQPEESSKGKGRELRSLTKSTESSDSPHVDGEKEAVKLPDNRESVGKDSDSSGSDDACPEEAKHMQKGKEISDSEAHEGANVASPSPSEGVANESLPEKVERPKKKESFIQEEIPSPEVVTEEAFERTGDSEAKPQRRSVKKASHETANKDKTSSEVGTSKNEDGTSDSEAKRRKQPGTKMAASVNDEDDSSMKKKKNGKKRRRGKASTEKQAIKSSTKDDIKEEVSSPKSPTKSGKEEDPWDEIRRKRKLTLSKEKASETTEYGQNLVGSAVKVWWPKDRMFYEGLIDSFDPVKKKHKVLYNDGDEEILNLRKERWEFVGDDSSPDAEAEAEPASTDASSEMKKKSAKKSAGSSVKHELEEVLPKRGSSASSSKSKGTSSKSGKKSKDAGKVDAKSRDGTSKSDGISGDETGNKSKAYSQKIIGRSVNDSLKSSGKSKDLDSNTPKSKSKQDTMKTASKSKEDTPKTAAKSKGKTPQSSNKSSANVAPKVKFSSSKGKDGGDVKEQPNDLTKTPGGTKRKLSDLSEERESETKGGKKRQRSVKG